VEKRRGRLSLPDSYLSPELIPKPLKPAFVDHFVELLSVGVEFEAELTNLVLLDFNVDGGLCPSLKLAQWFSGSGIGSSERIVAGGGCEAKSVNAEE
jgi:hypothetical protein